MRRIRRIAALFVAAVCASAASAASIHGYVFLMPVDSSFHSVGFAQYLNDLNQPASAALSGTHSVTGPSTFQTAVQGNGAYSNELEGPASPGQCFGTSLSVVANPDWLHTYEASWTGDTRCAPTDNGGGSNNGDGDLNQDCMVDTGCGSPVLLDLGGHGYHLTSSADGVLFDRRNEGIRRKIAWTTANSEISFLAFDRNGNGHIDNGAELFGNFTPLQSGAVAANGFVALAELDDNGDAVIDSRDAAWSTLLLWTDRDHDGESSAAELQPIAESIVVALGVEFRSVGKRDPWGNLFRYASDVQIEKNARVHKRAYYDVFFRIDT